MDGLVYCRHSYELQFYTVEDVKEYLLSRAHFDFVKTILSPDKPKETILGLTTNVYVRQHRGSQILGCSTTLETSFFAKESSKHALAGLAKAFSAQAIPHPEDFDLIIVKVEILYMAPPDPEMI